MITAQTIVATTAPAGATYGARTVAANVWDFSSISEVKPLSTHPIHSSIIHRPLAHDTHGLRTGYAIIIFNYTRLDTNLPYVSMTPQPVLIQK